MRVYRPTLCALQRNIETARLYQNAANKITVFKEISYFVQYLLYTVSGLAFRNIKPYVFNFLSCVVFSCALLAHYASHFQVSFDRSTAYCCVRRID
jgi:hypothetical protein